MLAARRRPAAPGRAGRTCLSRDAVVAAFTGPGEAAQMRMIAAVAALGAAGRDLLIAIWETSPSIEVRRWVIHGLGAYDDAAAKRVIRAALSDPAMSVRLHAIRAIGAIGNRALAVHIKPLMRDASGGIRVNALDVIVQVRAAGYRAVIDACLSDPKRYVRERAMYYRGGGGAMALR